MWLDLNGKRMQTGNSEHHDLWRARSSVAFLSSRMVLEPGDRGDDRHAARASAQARSRRRSS